MTRKKGMMTVELADKVTKQLPKGSYVWLHAWGEPLLNPKLDEIIRVVKSNGLLAGVITNAVLLDEDWSKRLLKSGLNVITFSLDGIGEVYEKIRPPARYESVAANINRFLELKREMGIRIRTRINVVKANMVLKSLPELNREWGPKVDQINAKPFNDHSHLCERTLRLEPRKLVPRKRVCRVLRDGGHTVLWDGRLAACCADFDGTMILGDLSREPLEKVIGGEAHTRMLREQREGKFTEICKYCHRD